MPTLSVLTTLLIIFGAVLLFNSLLSTTLYIIYREKLYKISALLWISTFVNFILQGVFQAKDILTVFAFSTYFITSIMFVLFYYESTDSKGINLKKYYKFGTFCLVGALATWLINFNFILAASFAALAIAYPMFDISLKSFKTFKTNNAVVNLFAIAIFFNALHFLDYPFLRHSDDNAVIGFSIALLLQFANSIVIPSLSILKIANKYSHKLEVSVEKRTKSLNQALTKLRSATNDNDALIGILCHDLANPITVLRYRIESLFKKAALKDTPEDEVQTLHKTKKSVDHMIEILDDVRNLHSIRLGKIKLSLSPVNLSQLIDETLILFKDRIQEKNIKFNIKCDAEDISIMASESTLKNQVFANLISNAIKFSFEGGVININISEKENGVELTVQDFGMGMPKKLQEDIFSFQKVTTRKGTQGEKGTGFGIPIVKTCLEQFGAEIKVKSISKKEHPEKQSGTEFNLHFKKAA